MPLGSEGRRALYILIFTLFQQKQCSNKGIDQCKQEPKTSVDFREEKGNSNVEIGYRISGNNENFIHVFSAIILLLCIKCYGNPIPPGCCHVIYYTYRVIKSTHNNPSWGIGLKS